MIIKQIPLDYIKQYIAETKREGMAGYSEKAIYYGAFLDDILVGFSSIQFYSDKAKFNNSYIFKEYRGMGYYKKLLDFRFNEARMNGCKSIVASCTKMSIREFIKRGAIIEKEFKICTNVKIIL